jgi:hypothetical protein
MNEGSWNIGPIRHMAATHKYRSRLLLYAEEIISVRSEACTAVNMNTVTSLWLRDL